MRCWRIVLAAVCCLLSVGFGLDAAAESVRGEALGGMASNPAALLTATERQISLELAVKSLERMTVTYSEPDYGYGAGALSWQRRGWDEGSLQEFSYSVARNLLPGLAAGMGVHYLSTDEPDGRYISSDLGLQYGPLDNLQLDLVLEDVLTYAFGEGQRQLDPNVRPGITVTVPKFGRLSLEIFDSLDYGEMRQLRAGIEWAAAEELAIRAGWRSDSGQQAAGWSVGFGFHRHGLGLNYAYLADDQPAHFFGVSWHF